MRYIQPLIFWEISIPSPYLLFDPTKPKNKNIKKSLPGSAKGMSGFEQDFLNFNFLAVPSFRRTFGASQRWLQAMDQAAAERDLPLQFCMALPSDLMATLELLVGEVKTMI